MEVGEGGIKYMIATSTSIAPIYGFFALFMTFITYAFFTAMFLMLFAVVAVPASMFGKAVIRIIFGKFPQ